MWVEVTLNWLRAGLKKRLAGPCLQVSPAGLSAITFHIYMIINMLLNDTNWGHQNYSVQELISLRRSKRLLDLHVILFRWFKARDYFDFYLLHHDGRCMSPPRAAGAVSPWCGWTWSYLFSKLDCIRPSQRHSKGLADYWANQYN